MTKRLLDIFVSTACLIALAVPLTLVMFLVWLQDHHSPLYIADRVGVGGRSFQMFKIRSMTVGADKSGVESTSKNDSRITPLGHFIRRWKIDEVSQLWNVLKGDMSLVGPRPNTPRAVADYSDEERRLLAFRPGITDFSSIVFSDEGEILKDSNDPDADYNRIIRPWKSRLGLLYVQQFSVAVDIQIIWLTVLAVFDKGSALRGVSTMLTSLGASDNLIAVARREAPLVQFADDSLLT